MAEAKFCNWKYDENHFMHETSCGEAFSFVEDGIEENGFKFCPYCGNRLVYIYDISMMTMFIGGPKDGEVFRAAYPPKTFIEVPDPAPVLGNPVVPWDTIPQRIKTQKYKLTGDVYRWHEYS